MALHKTAEFYTQWFRVCSKTASKFLTFAICESFGKQNNDSNWNRKYVHDVFCNIPLSECDGSWLVSTKQNTYLAFNRPQRSCSYLPLKRSQWKLFFLSRSIRIQNFVAPPWLVQFWHPFQKCVRLSFWSGWSHGTETYGVEVTFNDDLHSYAHNKKLNSRNSFYHSQTSAYEMYSICIF
jgi:hypothetical protein